MPVRLPGVGLPAGAYIFRLVTPSMVQVLNTTRSKIYATLLTVPASGIGDANRERIKFELDTEDDVQRIKGWYLPGDTGFEFLYSKPKRVREDRRPDR
jgi:hypothetical protein